MDLSVFDSLCILKFNERKTKLPFQGGGGVSRRFRGCFRSIDYPLPPVFMFLNGWKAVSGHGWLLDTSDICLGMFVCIYIRTRQLKVQQRGNVLYSKRVPFRLPFKWQYYQRSTFFTFELISSSSFLNCRGQESYPVAPCHESSPQVNCYVH